MKKQILALVAALSLLTGGEAMAASTAADSMDGQQQGTVKRTKKKPACTKAQRAAGQCKAATSSNKSAANRTAANRKRNAQAPANQ